MSVSLLRGCLVIAVMVFFMFPASAQSSYNGRVLDEWSGAPLRHATVFIPDFRISLVTDSSGAFQLSPNPGGKHFIELSHAGYHAAVVQVDFNTNLEDTFYLHRTVVENAPVVVTGVVRGSDSRKVPFTVSVMNRDNLMQQPGTNLVEQLSRLPGVNSVGTGPALSKPVIRGLGFNRVLVVQDGVRQEGQQWGEEHGLELDEWGVQRVEVLKGPASLIYGSDAMGGVVNIVTDVQVPDQTFSSALYSDYHSNNRMRTVALQTAFSKKGIFLQLLGSLRDAGDYHNKADGSVFNSRFQRRSLGAVAGIKRGGGYTYLKANFNHLKPGIIEGERDDDGRFVMHLPSGDEIAAPPGKFSSEAFVPYQLVKHTRVVLEHSSHLMGKRLLMNLAYQKNNRAEFGEPGSDDPELNFGLSTYSWMGRLHLKNNEKFRLSVGTNGMRQLNRNAGESLIVPDYDLTEAGAFVYGQRFLQRFTLTGGIRYDHRTISVDPSEGEAVSVPAFTKSFGNVSASLGGVLAFSSYMRLKMNLSRAYRSPSIAELSSNGAHEGTNRYEIGNTNLKNETSWQGDLAFEWHRQHVAFSVTGFVNYFSNYIFYRKLTATHGGDSLINVGGESLQAFSFNQHKAIMYGAEAEVDWHPHPVHWLHLHSALSLVYGKFHSPVDGSRNMPMVPPVRWRKEARADFEFKGAVQKIFVSLQSDLVFDQNQPFTGYGTETATDGYFLIHAGAGMDVQKRGRKMFSISAQVKNIGNVAYQQHLSRLKYTDLNPVTGRTGVFDMGRNFVLAINVPLQFSLK